MRSERIEMLRDTLEIFRKGFYEVNGKRCEPKLSVWEMQETRVFLPEDVHKIGERADFPKGRKADRPMETDCVNQDTFSLALSRMREGGERHKPILVLNLANPVNPGGGVRRGTRAQEEDLCRKSSLLISLESEGAQAYYAYNRSLHTFMGSDAILLTPKVEILKDGEGKLMEESTVVSVMTCAAPKLTYGLEGMSVQAYREMLYGRIMGMLKIAAYEGYEELILGAFGCGAFDNDAVIVSELFYEAIQTFEQNGMKAGDYFRRIDFAILCHRYTYNYDAFARYFKRKIVKKR